METSQKIAVSARYAYHIPNPFDQVREFYDKDGVLCFMSWSQYLEECAKPKNRFTRTTFESVMPGLCMAAGFLLICFMIGNSQIMR